MNIHKFAAKPTLNKITIDDPAIVDAHGDTIEFYMYDIVKLADYFEFFNIQQEQDYVKLEKEMLKYVLNEAGEPAIPAGYSLPIDILTAVIQKIGEQLGKSQTKKSELTNTQPDSI